MPDTVIDTSLIDIALDRATGSTFEKFILDFYPAIFGEKFIPLGGLKDGGADSFLSAGIFEISKPKMFFQVSIQQDYRSKIKQTVERLKDFGRLPKTVVYITSKSIKHIDIEEENLSDELDVVIKIRDSRFIATRVNENNQTRSAFRNHLGIHLDFLKQVGSARILAKSQHVQDPAVYVFLRQELERRQGKTELVESLADGLILWALEGTDPDKGRFLDRDSICAKIYSVVPAAENILSKEIPKRLEFLARIPKSEGRPLRWHKKDGVFCLAHEGRQRIETENIEDEALVLDVRKLFEERIEQYWEGKIQPEKLVDATNVCFAVIQKVFETAGLEFSAYLDKKWSEPSSVTVEEQIESLLQEKGLDKRIYRKFKTAIFETIRQSFYRSEPCERELFRKLSSTYTLLFCLKTDPRIINYFQEILSDFQLYVGTDILVNALSERYLKEEDQRNRNALKMIKEAGGTLILAEPVFEEVHSHIKATDYEYINNYANIDNFLDITFTQNIDRILIRAYFYSKLVPPDGIASPKSWSHFMNQFCDYSELRRNGGKELMRRYLLSEFNLEYETCDNLEDITKPEDVKNLCEALKEIKPDPRLAYNDALVSLAIYGKRAANKEQSTVNEFGYKTWWLTVESRILQYTKDIVNKHGASFIMRPDFLLKFYEFAPTTAQLRRTYKEIFPSVLGIKLARQVEPKELRNVLNKVKEASELEDGRREAEISKAIDELKSDFDRRYI